MVENKRNISLDFIRIIAVLAVVMIHTSAKVLTSNQTIYDFGVGNLFDAISRIAVPLFVMISGALMLDENRKITINKLLTKNVKYLLILLLFWSTVYSLIYNVYFPWRSDNSIKVTLVLKEILLGHFHLWYLYMIIGLYLITPFLRPWVNKKNKNLVLLFISISLLTQFTLPILNSLATYWNDLTYVVKFINKFTLNFFNQYISYYLIGWYVVHVGFEKNQRKTIYIVSLLSLCFTLFYVYFTKDYSNGYSNYNAFTFFYSTGVFLILNHVQISFIDKYQNAVVLLSKLTFGVYIIHVLILDEITRIMPYTQMPIVFILKTFLIVNIISFAFSYIGSKIPLIKNVFRM